MEGATSTCRNVIVFSVIFMPEVIASCETSSNLFLFASLSTVWFSLKIELDFLCAGSRGSVDTEPATLLPELGSAVPRRGRPDEHPQGFPPQKTAGFFLRGLTPVQTSACFAVVKAPSVRLVLLVALPCRSVLLSVLLCEYGAGVLSVPCLSAQEMLC